MELYEQIRREYEHGGGTIRAVARKLGVHRREVRKALAARCQHDVRFRNAHDRNWGRRCRSSTRFWRPTARRQKAAAHGAPDLDATAPREAGTRSGIGRSDNRPAPRAEAPARSQTSSRGDHDTALVVRRCKPVLGRRNRRYRHSAVVPALLPPDAEFAVVRPFRQLRNPDLGWIGGLRALRFPGRCRL